MTTAAAAWLASQAAAEIAFVLWIDGLGVGFTTHHDVVGLRTAWGRSGLYGGLRIEGAIQRSIEMFAAEISPGSLTFSILDYPNAITADMFGEGRPGIGSTRLLETVDADAVVIPVDDVTATPNGTLYLGLETLAVEATDPVANEFTVTRGVNSLFPPEGGTAWACVHEVAPDGMITPEVTSAPVNWINRRVGLYVCHKVGGTWSAGVPGSGSNDAELLWAGRIKTYGEDDEGRISIDCIEITELLKSTVGARMFEGELQRTKFEPAEAQIRIRVWRVNFLSPGIYDAQLSVANTYATHQELAAAINAAFADAFVTNAGTYAPVGTGASIALSGAYTGWDAYTFSMLQTGATDSQEWQMVIGLSPTAWRLLGWTRQGEDGSDLEGYVLDGTNRYEFLSLTRVITTTPPDPPAVQNIWQATANSGPRKYVISPGGPGSQELVIVPTSGHPFVQQTFIPDGFPTGADPDWALGYPTHGFVRINDDRVFAVSQVTATKLVVVAEVDASSANIEPSQSLEYLEMVDDDGEPIHIRQVWIEPYPSIGHALLCLLVSTGTFGYNLPLYDTLPAGLGLAFPTSILDVASVLALGAIPYMLVVMGPTPAAKLIKSMLDVAGKHAVWKDSKLTIVDPLDDTATPVPLTEDNKAHAVGPEEALTPIVERTTCVRNPESFINRLTLRYGPSLKDGAWGKPFTINAQQSQSDYGQVRSAVTDGYGLYGSAAREAWTIIAAAALTYFSRVVVACTRSFHFGLAPQLFPGARVIVDDDLMIDPTTGARGVSGLLAWVLSVLFDWGTGVGVVIFVFQPRAALPAEIAYTSGLALEFAAPAVLFRISMPVTPAALVYAGGIVASFPTVVTSVATTSAASLSHTVNLPASLVAGNACVIVVAGATTNAINFPAGWTAFGGSVVGASLRIVRAYRVLDGTEGASITVTVSVGAAAIKAHAYQVNGHGCTANAPGSAATTEQVGVANPDPPNLSPVGGPKNFLWIAVAATTTADVSADPANYSAGLNSTGTSPRLRTAVRSLGQTAENPGAFTAAATTWIAQTLAVHPGTEGL